MGVDNQLGSEIWMWWNMQLRTGDDIAAAVEVDNKT